MKCLILMIDEDISVKSTFEFPLEKNSGIY